MQVLNLTRKFRYNSLTLPDPNESMTIDQVREFYATQFPELNNAVTEGPTTENGVATWKFIRAAGAKGRIEAAPSATLLDARSLIERAVTAGATGSLPAMEMKSNNDRQAAARLVTVLSDSRSSGQPAGMPSQAFGIWG